MKVLIVDDDVALAEGIALYLRSNNREMDITVKGDGASALREVKDNPPDLIILDILLGDTKGYQVCRQIKETAEIPVIFLSNLAEPEDRIKGFLVGGDDYVTKPFSLQELMLRVNARLRDRNGGLQKGEGTEVSHTFGRIELRGRTLVGGEQEALLTETEYSILMHLARNPGRIVKLEEIYQIVWGEDICNDLRTVQTHTANLRKKLEAVYGTKEYIRTQWGRNGYVFRE